MNNMVYVYGGGGHAKVVVDILLETGVRIEAIVDDAIQGELLGIKVVRKPMIKLSSANPFVIAIGNNSDRKKVCQQLSAEYYNVIHPTSSVSQNSSLGTGCMIFHRCVVQAGTQIGNHVILNTGSQVDHDCIIADFVHIAPRVTLCGNVSVGEGVLIGAGAIILPGVSIGPWARVGAGAVVISNVNAGETVAGVPAKKIG
jgi:sugar O-acyltransferase (sialic acid O-acetyltransferase NeuD family)